MKKNIIFVTGFIGSDRVGLAGRLAKENNMEFVSLDQEIEAKDGRSILRITMTMGEHEVRNQEYEALKEQLTRDDIVVAVSDGIVLDDQCLDLLSHGTVVIADEDLSPEKLWIQAKKEASPTYAFLFKGFDVPENPSNEDDEARYQKFLALYNARAPIYRRISK